MKIHIYIYVCVCIHIHAHTPAPCQLQTVHIAPNFLPSCSEGILHPAHSHVGLFYGYRRAGSIDAFSTSGLEEMPALVPVVAQMKTMTTTFPRSAKSLDA